MADQEQSHASKRETSQTRKDGKVGESHGTRREKVEHAVKPGGTVGRDVPDQSKEHNTEVAVEAGRRDAEHRHEKR